MQRKSGFPMNFCRCSIKMPAGPSEMSVYDEDLEHQQRRQVLINFGHSQWGFNNWSWVVSKQELDFVELTNGKYYAGVATFVTVTVKNLDIIRENVGYSMSNSCNKGVAIAKARKNSVSNALRETLLGFGGTVAHELLELLELHRVENPVPAAATPTTPTAVTMPVAAPVNMPAPSAMPVNVPAPTSMPVNVPPPAAMPVNVSAPAPRPPDTENNQNLANKPVETKNMPPAANKAQMKEETIPTASRVHQPVKNAAIPEARSPPVARAHPIPAPPRPPLRPNDAATLARDLEGMTEEQARAERKRRQRQAQEEFRQKQLQKTGTDQNHELKNCSNLDQLMMEIPTQDIVIEETEDSAHTRDKRKSPPLEGAAAKRRAGFTRLDVIQTD